MQLSNLIDGNLGAVQVKVVTEDSMGLRSLAQFMAVTEVRECLLLLDRLSVRAGATL